jgi:c-di-GMP-binding flagellar brake protein YcgR
MNRAGTSQPVDLAGARQGRRSRELAPVRRNDLRVGVPTPYPIFDAHGRLLLRAGEVVDSERALNALREMGLYSDVADTGAVAGGRAPEADPLPPPRPEPQEPVGIEKPFAALKLPPGTVMHLDFLGESTGRPRVALRLIGHLEGGSVLVSAINAQGSVVPFREGELVQAKVVAGNDLAAFTSLVQKVCFSPFPYIHLGYPDAVQMKVLRRHARVETRLIVAATREGAEAAGPVPGLGVNLSASGMRFEAGVGLLERGARVRVGLRLPTIGEERTLSIAAVVRSVATTSAPPDKAHYGLEFDELSPVDRLVVEHFVFQGLLEA